MDETDRRIINYLQEGLPICECPYADAAEALGLSEQELLIRLDILLAEKTLTRVGPMYDTGRFGGGLTLAAMRLPPDKLEPVAGKINRLSEVAHNYQRDHEFNMWFVIAAESEAAVEAVIRRIESDTGFPVYNMPKLEEFYVRLKLEV